MRAAPYVNLLFLFLECASIGTITNDSVHDMHAFLCSNTEIVMLLKPPFKFTFHYRANPRQVTLRTAHNKYLSSEPNGVLSGSADAPNAWSLFELVSLGYVGFNNNIKL